MCVIVYLPKGTKISEMELENCWDTNPHGAGIAWVEDEVIHYRKGYMDYYDFYYTNANIINNISIDRVLHFRITSMGETSKSQTHPFKLSDNHKDYNKLECITKEPVMFMNGTIHGIALEKGLNDTASFMKNVIYEANLDYDNIYALDLIRIASGAKWCIMTPKGVYTLGDWKTKKGVKYSNLNHDAYLSLYNTNIMYGGKKSNKKSKKSKKGKKAKKQKQITGKTSKKSDEYTIEYGENVFETYGYDADYFWKLFDHCTIPKTECLGCEVCVNEIASEDDFFKCLANDELIERLEDNQHQWDWIDLESL